ncbi:E3.5.1.52 [Lepeophtheirus salmonis]|uniref:Peptide-N(4)-(N-acetyl-beta-glucosaminyl)asparagine amidase n=1 Tax=Lepeophtheirus salmonis TaxID=72036 RepID=A0A7R8CWW3_LEPSM|nr:E3.5.1.52 [Lepeophtheirus salmonis]CAF2925338.1 E3.5.1.52 [Lepeophtheirus salmonis]
MGSTRFTSDRTGKALSNKFFHRIISSDLARAFETAEIVKKNAGSSWPAVEKVTEFRERMFGAAENRPLAEFIKSVVKSGEKPEYYTPEGAETPKIFAGRIKKCLHDVVLSKAKKEDCILVVCHETFGIELRVATSPNTGISEIIFDVEDDVIKSIDTILLYDKSHLEPEDNSQQDGKKYAVFYFSAHWCPPCRQFTPILAQAYAGALGKKGEVIFVSSDRTEEEMYSYMKEAHGGWMSIDYKNSTLRGLLGSRLEVNGIPALVVVNLFDGSVMSRDARSEITSKGSAAFSIWDSMCSVVDTTSLNLLKDNEKDIMDSACDIFKPSLSNVIKDPTNMKYRSIKLGNPKISSALLNANGAFEVLFTVGFEESDDCLILPMNASISILTAFRDKIKDMIDNKTNQEEPEIALTSIVGAQSSSARNNSTFQNEKTSEFNQKILNEIELSKTYESSINQALATSCIPHESLEMKAKEASKYHHGLMPPNVVIVMIKSDFRFPRYHSNPSKLLETRRGRCGEWANCFALLARSMKYDVRRVLDWTDHVWVEIFSEHQDRWVHVDPCEGVLDKPLLYEVGWKKELSYVIATTSIYEVIDVTPRYVKCIEETKKNKRYLVQEKWLSDTIGNLTDSLMNNLSKEQKELCVQRRLKDLVELMSQKNPINLDESLPGRQSGSSAWRLQRGEVGEQFKPYVWKPNEHECETKEFELCYNVIEDTYIRGKERIVGWRNGLSEMKDLFRKEERDWNMVYLARKERLETGKLSWDIDLSETNLSVKCIELKIESKTYENGRVLWQLCGNNVCLIPSSSTTLNSEALAGAKKVSLTASLSGGKSCSWGVPWLFYYFYGFNGVIEVFNYTVSICTRTARSKNRISVPLGQNALLSCKIQDRLNYTLSWLRTSDLHILTVESYTFTSDERFRGIYQPGIREYLLQIKHVRKEDRGWYECQMSSKPILRLQLFLDVINDESAGQNKNSKEVHVTKKQFLDSETDSRVWTEIISDKPDISFKNGFLVSYGSSYKLLLTKRGNARKSDEGTYTCCPSDGVEAKIRIFVLEGYQTKEELLGNRYAFVHKFIINHHSYHIRDYDFTSILLTANSCIIHGYL